MYQDLKADEDEADKTVVKYLKGTGPVDESSFVQRAWIQQQVHEATSPLFGLTVIWVMGKLAALGGGGGGGSSGGSGVVGAPYIH